MQSPLSPTFGRHDGTTDSYYDELTLAYYFDKYIGNHYTHWWSQLLVATYMVMTAVTFGYMVLTCAVLEIISVTLKVFMVYAYRNDSVPASAAVGINLFVAATPFLMAWYILNWMFTTQAMIILMSLVTVAFFRPTIQFNEHTGANPTTDVEDTNLCSKWTPPHRRKKTADAVTPTTPNTTQLKAIIPPHKSKKNVTKAVVPVINALANDLPAVETKATVMGDKDVSNDIAPITNTLDTDAPAIEAKATIKRAALVPPHMRKRNATNASAPSADTPTTDASSADAAAIEAEAINKRAALVPPHMRKKNAANASALSANAPTIEAKATINRAALVPPHMRKKADAPAPAASTAQAKATASAFSPPKQQQKKNSSASFVKSAKSTNRRAPAEQNQSPGARSRRPQPRAMNQSRPAQATVCSTKPARPILSGWGNIEACIRHNDMEVRRENEAKAEAMKDMDPGVWTEKYNAR